MHEIIKDNDEIVILKNWHTVIYCKKNYYSSAMKKLLLKPELGMQGDMLKYDTTKIDTTTVAITQIDRNQIVLKRYNIKSFLHGLKRGVSRSRAAKCWNNAHLLLDAKIPTPQPIAIVEQRFGPFRRHAYFIYEYIDGMLARDFFTQKKLQNNKNEFVGYAKKYAGLIKRMFAARLTHGDINFTNFLVGKDNIYVLDLDGMRKHKYPWTLNKAKRKDINRFLYNWHDQPEIANVFKEYLQDNNAK